MLIFILLIIELAAQEKPGWQVDFRTDIYSRHLWRGYKMGNASAIEPELSLSKGKFGFTPFSGYYAENFAVVNLGVSFNESFSAGEKLEISFLLKLCTNQYLNYTWFVVGFGIRSR